MHRTNTGSSDCSDLKIRIQDMAARYHRGTVSLMLSPALHPPPLLMLLMLFQASGLARYPVTSRLKPVIDGILRGLASSFILQTFRSFRICAPLGASLIAAMAEAMFHECVVASVSSKSRIDTG